MNAFTIDGLVVPIMQGQATEQIERGGADDVRSAAGNLLTGTLWETSGFPLTTGLLTNAEAAEIKRRCAFGREVTCAGSIIDYAGGTLLCVVRVQDGPFITLATDDGSGVMRQLNLLVRAVNEPLEVAWGAGVSLSDATFSRSTTASYLSGP